ncbi:hypothetical protein ANACOL_03311 [Anaerotruncus colihominis DSM 17241]|uniref:Uncharacterized protein n=1 Tax=Anaerotruncus colihominis DSM 17241 TaxID=445972 RepID=B0PET3_9FIRM|nr:hypothetical protein ANACOL_03311 [Anaerotruncus colihominis DSM 17241]
MEKHSLRQVHQKLSQRGDSLRPLTYLPQTGKAGAVFAKYIFPQ